MGFGPMTGHGTGYCAGYSVPGYLNSISGRDFWGFGLGRGWFGRGGGRGWRHWYYAAGFPGWSRAGYGLPNYGIMPMPFMQELPPKAEIDMLREQTEFLKSQLDDIQNRISTLEKADTQVRE
jgi:hypothetical protein